MSIVDFVMLAQSAVPAPIGGGAGAWNFSDPAAWQRFIGRTHPMAVHFPIALITVAAIFEVGRVFLRRRGPLTASLLCLGFAVLTSGHAIGAGWLNAANETHCGVKDLVELHRWVGIGAGSLALLALVLGLIAKMTLGRTIVKVYVGALLLNAGVVGFAGHLGGSISYGEDYLFAPFRVKAAKVVAQPVAAPGNGNGAAAAGAGGLTFARDVLPIFESRCIECHGPDKVKGSLRLDLLADIYRADRDREVVKPGKPGESELIRRVSLPRDDDEHMPSRGEPLTAEQIGTLTKWIEQGGSAGEIGGAGAPGAAERKEDAKEEPKPAAAMDAETVAAIAKIRGAGGRVEPVFEGSGDLEVNLSVAGKSVTDETIGAVAKLGVRVMVLDLSGTGVSDEGVAKLAALGGLRNLRLARTSVGDAGVKGLAELKQLERVNLYGTKVTDAGLESLAKIATLKKVVVTQTGVTAAGVAALKGAVAGVEVEVA